MTDEIYKDDFLLIRPHTDTRVAVYVGNPPEEETPTIADAGELIDDLNAYVREQSGDNSTEESHE